MSSPQRSHADIASAVVAKRPRAFAYAAREAVIHNDFKLLNRIFPDFVFRVEKIDQDRWLLSGTGSDGSTCIWQVGG